MNPTTTTPPPMPDAELWGPADLARFLRVEPTDLDSVVRSAGVPVLYLGALGMRAMPSVVRAWAVSRSQSVITPRVDIAPLFVMNAADCVTKTVAKKKPTKKPPTPTRRAGGTATSGRLVQS